MPITPQEMTLFRNFAERTCGVQLGAEKAYLLESRLASLLTETSSPTFADFYRKAEADRSGRLRDLVIDALTTHETYWFRDDRPWIAFREEILPQLAAELQSGRRNRVRIWCAACSTGQEPYTVAMIIDDRIAAGALPGVRPEQFEILATDVSPLTVAQARKGTFNTHETGRGLSDVWRNRYFQTHAGGFEIKPALRSRVQFKVANLLEDFSSLGFFELIFCRNVAIYFAEEPRRQLFVRLARSLVPPALLFVGATESLMGISDAFLIRQAHGAMFYQRK